MGDAGQGQDRRPTSGRLWVVSVPVATVVALVLVELGLPWFPTWFFCVLGALTLTLVVVLVRGARGPDRSPLDRRGHGS